MRIPYISLIAAGALALGGCAYGDVGLGMGYGSPYYGYGYGSPYSAYGYNSSYYGYGNSPYYGAGYGSPFGWYNNYYYPGSGYYVYDSYRRPHVWSSRQRSYWTSRQTSGTTTRQNWSGFRTRSNNRNPNIVATWHEPGHH
jgi:hypothetical protein